MNPSIGIVAATPFEIAPLKGFLAENNIPVCITGIGAINTTYNLFHFLQAQKPGFVIQAGIAGSFDKQIPLSAVLLIEKDRLADVGVIENGAWKDFYELKLADANEAPLQEGWLVNTDVEKYNPSKLDAVTAISVNEVSTHDGKTKLLHEKYKPVTESMEGAAFHYVCLRQNVPFLQLRAISNYMGERDKSKWEIEKSILHLNKELETIIEFIRNEKR